MTDDLEVHIPNPCDDHDLVPHDAPMALLIAPSGVDPSLMYDAPRGFNPPHHDMATFSWSPSTGSYRMSHRCPVCSARVYS